MNDRRRHIETAVLSGPPGEDFGKMYSMHKYWSKKSPEVVSAYIQRYCDEGELVVDPFCGSGIAICEAVRLNRKAVAIDLNPMATFITRVKLRPVDLSRLQWAFQDVLGAAEDRIAELFATKCPKCRRQATIDFVVRCGERPVRIAYRCGCSAERLFKDPDRTDKRADPSFSGRTVPYWYPHDVPLPTIQKERFQYLHELFTRRNLIALSVIFHEIERAKDETVRDVLRLAFTGSLDKCSRLKPQSPSPKSDNGVPPRPCLSQSWVAVRFYAPHWWQEVNPLLPLRESFNRAYEGKKESNAVLRNVKIGSRFEELLAGTANVVVFTGSAESVLDEHLPEHCAHYLLTDPPFGAHIQYLSLSTFWGAWLKLKFDYGSELIVDRHRNKDDQSYLDKFRKVLESLRRTMIPGRHAHVFFEDVQGPLMHRVLTLMGATGFRPERIIHQPPPKSFAATVREKTQKAHYGSYIIRTKVTGSSLLPSRVASSAAKLRGKVEQAAKQTLVFRGGSAPVGVLLHSVYQKLMGDDILAFAERSSAEDFLLHSIQGIATVEQGTASLKEKAESAADGTHKEELRRAVLDARALYGCQEDPKNQIYQSVLSRLQRRGITIEDVREVDQKIEGDEEGTYRLKRYSDILRLFGAKLGFNPEAANGSGNIITWRPHPDVTCTFHVEERHVSVKACQASAAGKIASEVGTIPLMDLESTLWKWCESFPGRARELREMLNPRNLDGAARGACENGRQPHHAEFRVAQNIPLCKDSVKGFAYYLLELEFPRGCKCVPEPGQFYHVLCDQKGSERTASPNGREYPLTLRRPFSVHRIRYADFNRRLLAVRHGLIPYAIRDIVQRKPSHFQILYRVMGQGTQNLSEIPDGHLLDVIGPIGQGFKIKRDRKAVIVAGGLGVAPLVALAEELRYLGIDVHIYLGAMKSEDLRPVISYRVKSRSDWSVEQSYANGTQEFCDLVIREFEEIGAEPVVCTDDGSFGRKGRVTDIVEQDIESGDLQNEGLQLYACGPRSMTSAVSALAKRYHMPCQVLLEERMACGIGACLSCTCKIRDENGHEEKKRVCVDGPVFPAEGIIWQD